MTETDRSIARAQPVSSQSHGIIEPLHGREFARGEHRIPRRGLRELRSAVLARLRAYPYFALVKDCPGIENEKDFLRVLAPFGSPPPEAGLRRLLLGRASRRSVTEIKVDPKVKKESKFVTRYSRTSEALDPHTDGTARPRPFEIVMMYCVTADDEGGETILAPLDDVIARLKTDQYEILHAPTYPFGNDIFPIIETVRGQETIRYYRTQMLKSAKLLGEEWLKGAEDSLEALDAALQDPASQIRFKLQPGDLLIINNRKTLHGRTKMSDESERLLLRAQIFSSKVL